jgi:hypothetical protein
MITFDTLFAAQTTEREKRHKQTRIVVQNLPFFVTAAEDYSQGRRRLDLMSTSCKRKAYCYQNSHGAYYGLKWKD